MNLTLTSEGYDQVVTLGEVVIRKFCIVSNSFAYKDADALYAKLKTRLDGGEDPATIIKQYVG